MLRRMTQEAASTRTAVLRAAEQLFAVGGIEGPSDREIIALAGVGNKSAIRYHFGSRRGLVDAILADHGEVLRVRRALAYEQLVVGPGAQDLRGLCRVIVEPYATFLAEGPSQWAFLAVAQLVLEDPREDPMGLPERFHDPLLTVLARQVLDRLSLPEALGAERARVGVGHVIASLGARARQQIAGVGGWTFAPLGLFTPNLVDMLHGSLVMPPSTASLTAVSESAGGSGATGVQGASG